MQLHRCLLLRSMTPIHRCTPRRCLYLLASPSFSFSHVFLLASYQTHSVFLGASALISPVRQAVRLPFHQALLSHNHAPRPAFPQCRSCPPRWTMSRVSFRSRDLNNTMRPSPHLPHSLHPLHLPIPSRGQILLASFQISTHSSQPPTPLRSRKQIVCHLRQLLFQ